MAEEMETLETLFGGDPSADGNSPADAEGTGPDEATPSDDASAGDVDSRLSDLEQRYQRNTERLAGAEQSALQWKQRAESHEKLVEQLATQLQTVVQAQTQQTVPADFMQDMKDLLGYEPDPAAATRFYQNHMKRQQTQQPADADQYVTKEDQRAADAVQTARQQNLAALTTAHPELGDATNWQTFLGEVLPLYEEFRNNPAISALYPEESAGANTVQVGNRTLDLRLLDRAATEYKGKNVQRETTRQGPTQEGGGSRPQVPKGPVVPRSLVEGPDALLANPTVQEALKRAGWGANYKQQVERLVKLAPDAKKREWERQYRG